jgi:hypothetical protein
VAITEGPVKAAKWHLNYHRIRATVPRQSNQPGGFLITICDASMTVLAMNVRLLGWEMLPPITKRNFL